MSNIDSQESGFGGPIRNRFQMKIENLNDQQFKVTIQGIVGSDTENGEYFLAYWQNAQIGTIAGASGTKAIPKGTQKIVALFPTSVTSQSDYTFAFGVGGKKAGGTNLYYPVVVTLTKGWDPKVPHYSDLDEETYISSFAPIQNEVNVTINRTTGTPVNRGNRYLVVAEGAMTNFFKSQTILGTKKVEGNQLNNVVPIVDGLRHGSTYTIGYIFGVEGKKPDLNGLVAWKNFTF